MVYAIIIIAFFIFEYLTLNPPLDNPICLLNERLQLNITRPEVSEGSHYKQNCCLEYLATSVGRFNSGHPGSDSYQPTCGCEDYEREREIMK